MSNMVEMPRGRGIWLHAYEDVRSRTRFQWLAYSVLGSLALLGGLGFGWLALFYGSDVPLLGRLIRLIIPLAMLAYGLLEVPAGIIYFIRRRRGEPVDLWDFEAPPAREAKDDHHPRP